jgi:hypothetical protein
VAVGSVPGDGDLAVAALGGGVVPAGLHGTGLPLARRAIEAEALARRARDVV